ncbi:hypothetical protein FEDK69T_20210 [Flavobacterium enshiense DK69]|nr:hypothetical protein FEDK69T_20210 [Flavobacterium enshiense DK69]
MLFIFILSIKLSTAFTTNSNYLLYNVFKDLTPRIHSFRKFYFKNIGKKLLLKKQQKTIL